MAFDVIDSLLLMNGVMYMDMRNVMLNEKNFNELKGKQ